MNKYRSPSAPRTAEDVPYPATPENTLRGGKFEGIDTEVEPRSTRAAKCVGVAALYVTLYGGSFLGSDISQGIKEGKERVAHDHAQVHTVHEYESDDSPFDVHATVVLTGLGTKDATGTAETLEAHRSVGSVYAVEYGNKDLNTKDIAERILEQAQEDDISYLSLDGYSMGGPIALDVAIHIQQSESDVDVVSVILNSSPIGEGGLTERSAQSIHVMERILALHKDLVYYENGRVAIELAARSEHYLQEVGHDDTRGLKVHSMQEYSYDGTRYRLDLESLRHELSEITRKLQQPNIANANLIQNQASILKLDFEEKIQTLHEDTLVVYTRSDSSSGDTVVDVEASEHNIVSTLKEHAQPYKILRAHVQHANPAERREEYDRMIRGKIQPEVIYYLQEQTAPAPLVRSDRPITEDVAALGSLETKKIPKIN